MTSATLDTLQTEKKAGFLSSLFNKITAPLRDWVNEVQDLFEQAKNDINLDENLENSLRVKDAENIFIDAFYNAESTSQESLKQHIETIINSSYDLKDLGYTVDEVLELSQSMREENTAQLEQNRAVNLEL